MSIDILIVLVYFAFLMFLGWLYRSATRSTNDYFRGGGRMPWWMVGATAFMMSLSAMTFTGLMGKALTGGISIVIVFVANATGYFINYLFFAAKARQMRVVSPIQGIRLRFGRVNEQVFTWANVPLNVMQAAIWLNGLSVFVSAVLDIPIEQTVAGAGFVVLFMSLVGGSWAVIASDFLQMVLLTVMTFVAAVVAVVKSGGVENLMSRGLPEHAFLGDGYSYGYLFVGWFICIFVKQFFSTNNMIDSYRYVAAKDTRHARKAALLACGLTLFGTSIWFLPAWYVAGNYPDPASWGLADLGSNQADAAYYIFVKRELPLGMVGLMLSAMFAATMSSMDSALNRNAGILVKSVYEPYFCKDGDERKLMLAGKIFTAMFGLIVIGAGLFLTTLQEFGLFDAMMIVGTLVGFPLLIPAILCFFVRKTPDWAGWGSILVGMCVSAIIAFGVTPELVQSVMGMSEPMEAREFAELKSVTLGVGAHMLITLPFFLLTTLFYKVPSAERAAEIARFFDNVDTPVVSEDTAETLELDRQPYQLLGKLLMASALGVLLLVLVPNEMTGRLIFVSIAAILGILGFFMNRFGQEKVQKAAYRPSHS